MAFKYNRDVFTCLNSSNNVARRYYATTARYYAITNQTVSRGRPFGVLDSFVVPEVGGSSGKLDDFAAMGVLLALGQDDVIYGTMAYD